MIQPGLGATAWTLAPLPTYPIDRGDTAVVTGWVATAKGAAWYVTAVASRCPSTVNLVNVSAMLPAEHIACFDDKLPELAGGSIVRMTVHVNDPLSETCVMAELDDAEKMVPIPHDSAVYYCRERIVVDSYEVLGTDPDFPFG